MCGSDSYVLLMRWYFRPLTTSAGKILECTQLPIALFYHHRHHQQWIMPHISLTPFDSRSRIIGREQQVFFSFSLYSFAISQFNGCELASVPGSLLFWKVQKEGVLYLLWLCWRLRQDLWIKPSWHGPLIGTYDGCSDGDAFMELESSYAKGLSIASIQ